MYEELLNEWLKKQRVIYPVYGEQLTSKPFVGSRAYRHLDGIVRLENLESNEAERLLETLKDPELLSRHKFLPLIRRDKKQRRFTSEWEETKEGLKLKRVTIKQKLRPLMYASHRDAVIYAFYAWQLKVRYEKLLKQHPSVDQSVIAYRKIPRENEPLRGKSNIDFALEVKNYISSRGDCVVLCLDVSNFFGTLDHALLHNSWSRLLEEDVLGNGHDVIFKNITRYNYFFRDELLEGLNLGKNVKGKFLYYKHASRSGILCKPKEFNAFVKKAHDTDSPLLKKNRKSVGIPQGSPISDILANLYMLDLDLAILELLERELFNKFYRRYSDDVLLVCDKDKAPLIYEKVKALADIRKLIIKNTKTEAFRVDRAGVIDITYQLTGYKGHKYSDKDSVRYLGFEFDTRDIHIRSGTVAKQYRRALKQAKHVKNIKKVAPRVEPSKEEKSKQHNNYLTLVKKRTMSKRAARQIKKIRKRIQVIKDI